MQESAVGFFSLMFGDRPHNWSTSENGNAMIESNGWRLTVYPRDHGWKFALADLSAVEEVYYSERLSNEEEAKAAGLEMLYGTR
jgi:hypothetical protein